MSRSSFIPLLCLIAPVAVVAACPEMRSKKAIAIHRPEPPPPPRPPSIVPKALWPGWKLVANLKKESG